MFEINALPQARKKAQDLAGAGDPEGARELLERAVESNRAALAEGDPELLAAMRDLATLRSQAGDPMSARRLLEEARAAAHRLAPSDPLAVMLAYDLGTVAEELGNRHVARTSFAEVTANGPAALGQDHWVVEHARAYLAAGTETAGAANEGAPPLITIPDAPPATSPIPAPPQKPIPPLPESNTPVPTPAPPLSASGAPLPPSNTPFPASGAPLPPSNTALPGPAAPLPPSKAPLLTSGTPISSAVVPGTSSRKSWIIAAAGILVGSVIAATAVLARPGEPAEPAAAPAASEAAAQVQTPTQAPPAAVPPAAPSARPATPSTAAARTGTTAATAAPSADRPQTSAPVATPPAKPVAPIPAAKTTTRIVAPAGGSKVPYPFDARFTVSAADVKATGTVVAVLVCVNGRCYLDGKVDIVEGVAAPYTIYLGSTKPEGTGVTWSLRLDRLTSATYNALLAEREARWADGSWGDKGTTMSRLNPTPVSAVSVIKTGA
ncbi:tetratricopeptide repeat protein [Paractinoplanes atraurantiacus]|uniref:tetratricopeptide repeat protein n=1 Tax=Paractinoplanes atraurantiacus TaxID=1036182 RepID=UPI0015CF4319|nr:tetratricopeptide repeat protein [Actinoplanes atraurantiacus]